VDTTLIGNQNVFVYVPSLRRMHPDCTIYEHEYLAHGVIESAAHKAVALKHLVDIGLPFDNLYGLYPKITASPHRHISRNPVITEQELRDALAVAERYGGDFVVPVTVAILCQKKRDDQLWQSGNIPRLNMVAEALEYHNIPEDWRTNVDILTDIVESGGYGDVDQMFRLLRALLHYRYGKGARTGARQL
jgi:hypothetical protein